MSATQHPLQEHHQLAAAMEEGDVFIDEAQLSVLFHIFEECLHDGGHFLQPGNDEAEHCFEQVVDDSTVTLWVLSLTAQVLNVHKEFSPDELGEFVGTQTSKVILDQLVYTLSKLLGFFHLEA